MPAVYKLQLRFFLLVLIAITVALNAHGQNLSKAHRGSLKYNYYKLTSEQAQILYHKGSGGDIQSFMNNLVLEVPLDSFDKVKPQEPGHYLYTYAINHTLYYKIYAKPFVRVNARGVLGEGQLKLYDFNGKAVIDASVKYQVKKEKWQTLPFDNGCACYPLVNKLNNTMIKIEKGDLFDIYYVTNEGLNLPSINRSNPYGGQKVFPGYMVFNKPKYRHFDTLKMKSFVVDNEGRPLRRKLDVYLYANYKEVKLASIKPVSPGAYLYDFVVADSLRLNSSIILRLKSGGVHVKSNSVIIEDYELKKASYQSRMLKSSFKKGEKIEVVVDAFDANKMPMLDTRIKLNVKFATASGLVPEKYKINDSILNKLYTYNDLIDQTGTSIIEIPDSVLLPILGQYTVSVQLINAEGEYKNYSHSFNHNAKATYHKLGQVGNRFLGVKYVNGVEQKGDAVTLYQYGFGHTLVSTQTAFPLNVSINPSTQNIRIVEGDSVIYSSGISDYSNLAIAVSGQRTHDSIKVKLQNDWNLDVYYRVYRNKQIVAKGYGKEIDYKAQDKSMWPYYVLWGYQWAGQEHFYETQLVVKEKELKIKVHQPKAIFPGEKVDVKISVSDYKNKPLKKVNLTAFAVNMEFAQIPIPEMPYFGRSFPNMMRRSNYYTRQPTYNNSEPINDAVFDKIKVVDTNYYLYYMHPKKEIKQFYQDNDYEKPEFVPMVFYDGVEQPIIGIWINDNLVTTQINESNSNQLIRYPKGEYTVKIRLHKKIITLKNITLSNYKRLYLSVDLHKCKASNYSEIELYEHMLTQNEYNKINEQTLFLDYANFNNDTVWIENGSRKWLLRTTSTAKYKVHWYKELQKNIITITGVQKGPTILRINRDTIYFNFEPNNYYTFQNEILSSYPLPNYPLNRDVFTGHKASINSNLGAVPLYFKSEKKRLKEKKQRAKVEKKAKEQWQQKLRLYSYYKRGKHNARIQIFNPSSISLRCIWLVNNEQPKFSWAYNGNSNNYSQNLKRGSYTLIAITTKGKVYIKNDIDINHLDFQFVRLQFNRFVKGNAKMVEPYRAIIHQVSRPAIKSASLFPELFKSQWTFKSDTSDYGSILGHITDKQSFLDITQATVLLEQNGYIKNAVITNNWGEFIFRNVPEGEYMLKIQQTGYRYTIIHKLKVLNGKTSVLDFKLERSSNYVQTVGKPVQESKLFETENQPLGNGQINIQVFDGETNENLLGATVVVFLNDKLIKGATTNYNGLASVSGLVKNNYTVKITYVGYVTRSISINLLNNINHSLKVPLFASDISLDEVVVAADAQYYNDYDGSFSNSVEEISRMPVRNINSINSTTAGVQSSNGNGPVIRGGRSAQVITYIDGMPVRGSGAMAQSSYGEVAKGDIDFSFGEINATTLRDDNILSNTLDLLNGKTPPNRIRTNFKDYAFWVPNLITDNEGNSYFTAKFPDNITQWKTIVPAMDYRRNTGLATAEIKAFLPYSAQLGLPRFLVKGDKVVISGKVFNYTNDTLDAKIRFENDGNIVFSEKSKITRRQNFTTTITGNNKDSIDISFIIDNDNGFKEGEKRVLKVYDDFIEKSRVKTISVFNDTSFTIKQESNEKFGVIVFNNKRDFLLEQINRLKGYNYGCVEQTASKLYALLAEKQLCSVMGKKFNEEKYIKRMMARLSKMQKINGSWGWWVGDKTNDWITLYVVKVLAKAQGLGYNSISLTRGLNYIKRNQEKYNTRLYLEALTVLKQMGLKTQMQRFEKLEYNALADLDKLFYLRVQQLIGKQQLSSQVMLLVKKNPCGQLYWGSSSRYFYSNKSFATMLALQVLAAENVKPRLVKAIEKSLFEKACNYGYMNTLERALLIGYLLENMQTNTDIDIKKGFFINGNKVIDYPKRIEQVTGEIDVKYVGEIDALVLVVRKDKVRNASPDSANFTVKTLFYQSNKKVQQLKQGSGIQMEVSVYNRITSDFAMIEVPIPAGCSYSTTPLPKFGYEIHREYRRNKVIIYCTELPAGNHKFRIALEPRFKGDFKVLPTNVEEMYKPQNSGNNGLKQISID
ncbi:MAG: beta-sandwich domain-containing protein [Bacteroidia bacterium]